MGPNELFGYLWATKYLPAIADRVKLDSQRRAEAFADATVTVCGEELRLMTPRDLLMLDGFESPFVTYQRLPSPEDCAFFIWQMHARNTRAGIWNAWRRGRCYERIAVRPDLAEDVAEIEEYCARVFIDVPPPEAGNTGKERKPPSIYFLAAMLGDACAAIGPHDPMSGALLADTPIPRLIQYLRNAERKSGNSDADLTEFDSQKSRCLSEVNEMIAARRGAA